jgi:hypothetical protein
MEHKSWGTLAILLPASCDAGKNDVLDNLCLLKMDRIIQYIVFLVFHGKSTTFFNN